jgi:ABC-type multidrug transport system ATPase subunit
MAEFAETGVSTAATTISVRGVRHVYKGGTVALDGVDLECGTGLFGLLGPNGAGKSTLMRIMCTLIVPTAGTATVGGHDVQRERLAVRSLIGYLPQEFGGWRLQRVEEVLDTLAVLSGLRDRKRRRQRVEQVLEQVGLREVAGRKVKKLSGGMVRRLGVAQALIHEPRVLVVDEPTVGLDPQERLRFRKLMASLGQDRTIVLSTHIVADLGSSCRDLALIDSGKIVFRGSPEDLMRQSHGRVFQVATDAAGQAAFEERYEVVSRVKDGETTRIRAVSRDGGLPDGAKVVDDPTLEEAYLAFMAARGRGDAVLAEEKSS